MVATMLAAELRFRNGKSKKISVEVENSLTSLLNGVKVVNTDVSQLLSEMVEQEKAQGACALGKDDEDDSEDDEDDNPHNLEHQPPAKKPRT